MLEAWINKERCLVYEVDVIVKDGICTEDCICDDCALVDPGRIKSADKNLHKKDKKDLKE